jgi:lysophospholipase L1-like esterase
MSRTLRRLGFILALVALPTLASAQVNFEKTSYYVAMGDSVAAGEGAMPVTNGYVYRLYDQGVFAKKQEMDFSNIALRGARSWELFSQVSQVLCVDHPPTVVTITAGANDFLGGDLNIPAIAGRVAAAINLLLNNGTPAVPVSVTDPVTNQPCPALSNVTILVSNYYSMPHPVPEIYAMLDAALNGFDQTLRFFLAQVPVPSGSKVAYVDLYTPSLGRQGLVTIDRRLGYTSPFDFDFHPTNLGHAFIASQFELAWKNLQ